MLIGPILRFNLVIEILFFSRIPITSASGITSEFQSRNRDTFLFKLKMWLTGMLAIGRFQSRNRDTFLFKCATGHLAGCAIRAFQSRNRDTFLFKPREVEDIEQQGQVSIS